MALVSVTRLRLRRPWFLLPFAPRAVASFRQAQAAQGFLDGAVLRDRRLTFWTLSLWEGMESLRAYMLGGAHGAAMPLFVDWCDQACVVHWEQEAAVLPSWPEAERRMRQDGRPSRIRHPAPGHQDLSFAPARTSGAAPMRRSPTAG